MKKEFDIITIGGATRDIFFKIPNPKIFKEKKVSYLSFEYGSKITSEDAFFSYGGGANNVAISAARLSLSVAAFIQVGKEGTGDIVIENLIKEKVNTSFISRDKIIHTGMSFILNVPGGDRTIFNYPGANINLKLPQKLPKTKWIYLSSLRGESAKILDYLPKIIKNQNIKLAFNPGENQLKKGYKYLKKILNYTSILILNLEEAEDLVVSANKVTRNTKKLFLNLFKMGPEVVVITNGKKGSYAYDGKRFYQEKCFQNKPVDTTGAGDAYGSTFISSLILGFDIKKAMHFASKNSASVVSFIGSQKGLLKLKDLIRK